MMPEARVAPPLTPADASRIANSQYGLEATARPLPGEYDDNFHLQTSDSRAFVLKVMHPAREESFVDMQSRVLSHLASRAPHLALPRGRWPRPVRLAPDLSSRQDAGGCKTSFARTSQFSRRPPCRNR